MRHRQVGDSGLTVSVVGLGGNNFRTRLSDDDSTAVVDAAIDAGISLFDTADFYGAGGSEELLGEVLGRRRDHVVLATKFGLAMPGEPLDEARGSRRYIRRAVRASLRRLRSDWIDLYQLHVPDPLTPIEETLSALDELVTEGLVRYVGSSNLTAWQIVEADWTARTARRHRFISAQNRYNLLERGIEHDIVPVCERYAIGLLPFFPLANGLLSGKYRRGEPLPAGTRLANEPARAATVMSDDALDRLEALEQLAHSRGVTILQLAIGGLAALPAVASVIAGASSAAQVKANASAGEWIPTTEDMEAIDAASSA